jgi:hypothetical protein
VLVAVKHTNEGETPFNACRGCNERVKMAPTTGMVHLKYASNITRKPFEQNLYMKQVILEGGQNK